MSKKINPYLESLSKVMKGEQKPFIAEGHPGIKAVEKSLVNDYGCTVCGDELVYYNGLCFGCYHDKKIK